MPTPKSPSPPPPQAQAQALQTIDPTALAAVSGGARSGRSATSADSSSGGGGSSDAVLGALTGILDSLQSLTKQRSPGFNPEEMMMFMMMMGQRNNAVQVVQPALPVIYADGTQRIF